jgi:hypothetical protein
VPSYLSGGVGNILMLVTVAIILLSIGLGVAYAIVFNLKYEADKRASKWK